METLSTPEEQDSEAHKTVSMLATVNKFGFLSEPSTLPIVDREVQARGVIPSEARNRGTQTPVLLRSKILLVTKSHSCHERP